MYFYSHEALENFDMENLMDAHEVVETLVDNLLNGYGIKWDSRRGLRDHERQAGLFETSAAVDTSGPDEVIDTGEAKPDEKTREGELEESSGVSEFSDKDMQSLLGKVLVKAPTLKTVNGYTDEEYAGAIRWAEAVISKQDGKEVEVPEKPAFLGPESVGLEK